MYPEMGPVTGWDDVPSGDGDDWPAPYADGDRPGPPACGGAGAVRAQPCSMLRTLLRSVSAAAAPTVR